MRRAALLLTALAAALDLGGCGSDSDRTDPVTLHRGPPPTRAELASCLRDSGLKLRRDAERAGLEIHGTTYMGYVRWPSGRVADVYVSKDVETAERAEEEIAAFVKAFGGKPIEYVRRSEWVTVLRDDPPPAWRGEVDVILSCS